MQASGSSLVPVVPKRVEEAVYFEEDYREEIITYMTSMDVSLFFQNWEEDKGEDKGWESMGTRVG